MTQTAPAVLFLSQSDACASTADFTIPVSLAVTLAAEQVSTDSRSGEHSL